MTGTDMTGADRREAPFAFAAAAADGPGRAGGPVAAHKMELPRSGARPLRFTGVLVAEADLATCGGVPGYAARLYRKRPEGAVVGLQPLLPEATPGRPQAWQASDTAAALELLRRHDPALDVTCSVDPDDPAFSHAEIAAHILDLRARVEVARIVLSRLADMLEMQAGLGV
jgi:hypothetical protein